MLTDEGAHSDSYGVIQLCKNLSCVPALSFALRTLYDHEERPDEWGEAVLSTAALLGMSNLFQK